MIQAAAVSTAQPGPFATLIARLFSGLSGESAPGAGTRVRRKPTPGELARCLPVAEAMETVLAAEADYAEDRAFCVALDRKVTEPIREIYRAASAFWTEPYLGMIGLCLSKTDRPNWALHEGKLKRKKALAGLAEVPTDLRKLAEMQ